VSYKREGIAQRKSIKSRKIKKTIERHNDKKGRVLKKSTILDINQILNKKVRKRLPYWKIVTPKINSISERSRNYIIHKYRKIDKPLALRGENEKNLENQNEMKLQF
jgi:hypothetical protein